MKFGVADFGMSVWEPEVIVIAEHGIFRIGIREQGAEIFQCRRGSGAGKNYLFRIHGAVFADYLPGAVLRVCIADNEPPILNILRKYGVYLLRKILFRVVCCQ